MGCSWGNGWDCPHSRMHSLGHDKVSGGRPECHACGVHFRSGVPPGDAGQHLETFPMVTTGGTAGIQWVEASDAAKYRTAHRTAPPTVSAAPASAVQMLGRLPWEAVMAPGRPAPRPEPAGPAQHCLPQLSQDSEDTGFHTQKVPEAPLPAPSPGYVSLGICLPGYVSQARRGVVGPPLGPPVRHLPSVPTSSLSGLGCGATTFHTCGECAFASREPLGQSCPCHLLLAGRLSSICRSL